VRRRITTVIILIRIIIITLDTPTENNPELFNRNRSHIRDVLARRPLAQPSARSTRPAFRAHPLRPRVYQRLARAFRHVTRHAFRDVLSIAASVSAVTAAFDAACDDAAVDVKVNPERAFGRRHMASSSSSRDGSRSRRRPRRPDPRVREARESRGVPPPEPPPFVVVRRRLPSASAS
jgi:hypothetical protein